MIRLGFRYYLGRVVQWFRGRGVVTLEDATIGLIREHQAALDDAWSAGYAEGYQDGNRDAGGDGDLGIEVEWSDDEEPPSTTRQRRLTAPPDPKLN